MEHNHDGPRSESLVETHLGVKPQADLADYVELTKATTVRDERLRDELAAMIGQYRFQPVSDLATNTAHDTLDKMLDRMNSVAKLGGYGMAALYLNQVKRGQL